MYVRIVCAAGVTTTFGAFGRAVEQNRSGVFTQIVYSPSGAKFAYMNGAALIKYIDPMVAGMAAVHNGNDTGYFQHADWLGSSRFGQTGGGTVAYDRAYAPFGEPYAETASTNRNFTGQTEDTTPGLYDFLLRQHSQSQGRWLVPDPAGLAAVDTYIKAAGIADDRKGPLFRAAIGKTKKLGPGAISRTDVWYMVRRRAANAGIETAIGCHSFRATGITDYLTNGGRIEVAQRMAGHSNAKTTGLYDRRNDDISVGEVERIGI
jgi:RHS repeat-associated protein